MRTLTGRLPWRRSWGIRPAALLGAATVAGWYLVPAGPVAVPASGGVQSLLWPMLPVVAVLGVPGVLGSAYGDMERASSRPVAALRLGAAAGCALLLALVVVLDSRFDDRVVWRNTAFLFGLALIATAVLPTAFRWQPLVLVPAAMWLLGTDEHRRVRSWNLLLLPGDRPAVSLVAASTLIAGAALYLLPRTGDRQP